MASDDARPGPVVKDGNIPNKPDKTNWVEQAGGLPPYIRRVAEDLHSERGMSVSHAIAAAINRIKVWSRGGGDVKPETQAKAQAALAQWSKMKTQKALDTGESVQDADLIDEVAKGLNYMEKPHRFTPGPAGMCLFCSNSQRWHTENRPKTPAEVEQEKKDRAIQEKNDDALGSALMLTPLPTEDDALQQQLAEQKKIQQAEKIGGAPLQDPNDPLVAAGVAKAEREAFKKALAQVLAKKMSGNVTNDDGGDKPASGDDAPLVQVQYDPNKKAGGINEAERKKLADEGIAMEDGTFPIRDEKDLKAALKFWGKATDPHEAREHIIVRAVELGLEDLLPQNIKDHQEYSEAAAADESEGEQTPTPSQGTDEVKKAAYAITKSSTDEKRYTLGPMYIPDRLDAHNEFATADELQKAVWDYVRTGDRQIRLQHNTDIVAGECVEVLSWPTEITASMALPSTTLAKSSSVTFPAGTTYMGIVWEPWAWEWVKKGKISGLSMGGFAKRVAVEFDRSADADLIKALDGAIAKYNPGQPRDSKGRWTDGPASIKINAEMGNAAANTIGDRKKWNGPWDAETKTWTPFDPDKVWRELPEKKKSAVRRLLDTLGLEWEALAATMRSNSPVYTPTRDPQRDYWASDGLRAVGKQFDLDPSLLAQALETTLAKHGRKGTPNYPHRPRGGVGAKGGLTVDSSTLRNPSTNPANPSPAKGNSVTPLTDEEYAAHLAKVDELIAKHAEAGVGYKKAPLKSPNATLNLHARPGTDNSEGDNYTDERRAAQDRIIDKIIADAEARGVPKDKKSWIAGGLPGAGKTSYLKSKAGATIGIEVTDGQISNAVVINPDDIKVALIDAGLGIEVDGLDPLETVAFLHEESSHVADRLAARAMDSEFNIVYDITAHSHQSVGDRVKNLRDAGYNDTTYFMLDVSIKHSLDSAAKRHRAGLERRRSGRDGDGGLEEKAEFGGRYVPPIVIKDNALDPEDPVNRGHASKMAFAFDQVLEGQMTTKLGLPVKKPERMVKLDNEGYASSEDEKIGRVAKPPVYDSKDDALFSARRRWASEKRRNKANAQAGV